MPITYRSLRATAGFVVLLAMAACTQAESPPPLLTGPVAVGGKNDQPGFNTEVGYTHRGFEPTLTEYLGEKIDFVPKFVDVPSNRREEELTTGSVELVVATYSITEARKRKVDFVGPYLKTYQGLLVRSDDDSIRGEGDIDGKNVCTVEGSTSAEADLPKSTNVILKEDYLSCVERLRAGERGKETIDAVFTDLSVLYGYTQVYKDVEVVPRATFGKPNRYGIGIPKGHPGDCKQLQAALKSYLRTRWAADFGTYFPTIVEAYPDEWEHDFKPDPTDVDRYSQCTSPSS